MTCTQGRSDSGMTAGDVTALVDPLHCRPAPIRGEAELVQVQSLPGSDRGGCTPDHPTFKEPGARGAEPAVPVEDEDRQGRMKAYWLTCSVSHDVPESAAWPRVDEPLANVLEQHGESLRLPDDGKEVRVAAPPRDDVLVQVGAHASPGNSTLVDPDVVAHG